MDQESLTLRHGPLACVLAPGCGGSIANLALDRSGGAVNLMRPSPSPLPGPLDAACFPLVPFSNRIAAGRFRFGARDVQLPLSPPLPHAIHGQGWLARWSVEEAGPDHAVLSYEHAPEAWPYPYHARQRFELSDRGLAVAMELTNLGGEVMPAGLGLHPYFPKPAGTRLTAGVGGVWLPDEAMLPSLKVDLPPQWDLPGGIALDDVALDHGFSDWIGEAAVDWPELGLRLRITADDLFGHLVVYVPPGAPWLCVEPVSHMTDAINRSGRGDEGTGHRELGPGATLSGRVIFSAEPLR